jgi:hypothetical protein
MGRVMLAYPAYLAQERKCGRPEWPVLDWNESAIRFYQSLRAEAMDQWTRHRLTGPALAQLADEFEAKSGMVHFYGGQVIHIIYLRSDYWFSFTI